MKCSNCGTEFEGKFCPQCGTSADGAAPSSPPPEQQTDNRSGSFDAQPYTQGKGRVMKRKKKPFFLRWWFILLVVVVAIIVALAVAGNNKKEDDSSETGNSSESQNGTDDSDASDEEVANVIEWPKMELGYLITEPPTNEGDVMENSDEELWINYVDEIADNEYNDYLDACIEKGFTIDPKKDSSQYKAYNTDGYCLELDNIGRFSIRLTDPMEFGTITWPKGIAGSIVPAPKSTTGKFSYEYDDNFSVYIGETPREDYEEYVSTCSDAGFTVDYDKTDYHYRAYNADGWYLSLAYEGNSIMLVQTHAPDDFDPDEYEAGAEGEPEDTTEPENTDSEDTADPDGTAGSEETTEPDGTTESDGTEESDETAEPEETAEPDDAVSEGGLRPEFKEAMDSYENFMNEYVDFMKKYEENPDDISFLADYAKYMADYADAMEKFDAWEGEDLNTEELQYYIEVQSRVSQKLVEVGQ